MNNVKDLLFDIKKNISVEETIQLKKKNQTTISKELSDALTDIRQHVLKEAQEEVEFERLKEENRRQYLQSLQEQKVQETQQPKKIIQQRKIKTKINQSITTITSVEDKDENHNNKPFYFSLTLFIISLGFFYYSTSNKIEQKKQIVSEKIEKKIPQKTIQKILPKVFITNYVLQDVYEGIHPQLLELNFYSLYNKSTINNSSLNLSVDGLTKIKKKSVKKVLNNNTKMKKQIDFNINGY
jgi:hypothetical protein